MRRTPIRELCLYRLRLRPARLRFTSGAVAGFFCHAFCGPRCVDNQENAPYAKQLTTRSESEVCEAIQTCATRCMGHADPATCARQYGSELVAAGWTQLDARQVEIGALRVIANLTGNDALYPEPY